MSKIANPEICERIKHSYGISWKDVKKDYSYFDSIDSNPSIKENRIVVDVFGYIVIFNKIADNHFIGSIDKNRDNDVAEIDCFLLECEESIVLQGKWIHQYGFDEKKREEFFEIKIFK